MLTRTLAAAIAAALFLSGCATNDPYARTHSFGSRYEQYRPSVVELARMRTGNVFDYEISDVDIVNYADHVKSILRSKFTNARFARYTSATGQVLLGGLAGAAAAFDAGSTTVAALALSSAALPQIGGIFNAKARAESYQDAVRLIEEAETDYLSEVGSPSSRELTANGVILYQRTTATVHIVEKAIVGQLPTLKEMKEVSGDVPNTPRRPKRVIKTLSGKTAPTTSVTATTVTTHRENVSISSEVAPLEDSAPPPQKRGRVNIKAGTPSLDDESASSSGHSPRKRETEKIGEAVVSLDADPGMSVEKRSNVQIKKGTGELDSSSEVKKRGDASIKGNTASLDSSSEVKKRGDASIKGDTGSLDESSSQARKRRDASIKKNTESLDDEQLAEKRSNVKIKKATPWLEFSKPAH